MPRDAFGQLVKKVSDHYKSDIVLYIGPIERPYDDAFIRRIKGWKQQLTNVILILTTHGGDPHAAYRMARCLQEQYETVVPDGIGIPSQGKAKGRFRLFVDTRCKSAGTILAAGANCVMFSDYGEIGPIDVQVRKGEEVGERSSVLTPKHAMESLQVLALHHFQYVFKELRFSEEFGFSTKMAAPLGDDLWHP
jgi:membrane-bound ClpP family serine protease